MEFKFLCLLLLSKLTEFECQTAISLIFIHICIFSENTDKTKEDPDVGESPVPDMCPTEGERISYLPDVIVSARMDSSENHSASPSLVCDNSPFNTEEDMDTSNDREGVLNQSENNDISKRSEESYTFCDEGDEEKSDKSNLDNQQVEVSTENIEVNIEENETSELDFLSKVNAYQSDKDQSVEEKRAEHYSKINTSEVRAASENSTQEAQENFIEESKELESNTTEIENKITEMEGSSEGLVFCPLDVETTEKHDDSGTQLQDTSKNLDKNELCTLEENLNNSHTNALVEPSASNKAGHVHIHLDNTSDFDSFQFWRTPIPQLDLDLDIIDGQPKNIHVTARVKDEEHHKVYASEMNVQVGEKDMNPSLSDSMSDLTLCDKLDGAVINTNRSKSVSEEEGLRIHKASISSVSEADNYLQGGSMSLVGQNENTLTVIDGDVQGKNYAYIL